MVSSALGVPFNYSDFSSIAGIDLVGDAIHTGNRIRLTPAVGDQAGAAWYTSKQYIEQGFETVFQFQISDLGGHGPGADGFGFLIQNTSTSALGLYGGSIGYAGITNSIAIEFDTYHNLSFGDPDDNHISVQTRGTAENSVDHAFSLGCTSAIPNMSDENIHTAKVKYTPETLSVFLDDLTNPCLMISSADVLGLLQLDAGRAWVGFTAATGSGYENHDILSWEFHEIPEPATLSLLGLGSLSLLRRRKNNQLSADQKKTTKTAFCAAVM